MDLQFTNTQKLEIKKALKRGIYQELHDRDFLTDVQLNARSLNIRNSRSSDSIIAVDKRLLTDCWLLSSVFIPSFSAFRDLFSFRKVEISFDSFFSLLSLQMCN